MKNLRSIRAVDRICVRIVGDPGVAAHSTCSGRAIQPLWPRPIIDGGICRAFAQSLSTNRGNTGANMASESRFAFLSGAAIAYGVMVAHEPLPPEIFCTYHAESSG